MALAMAPDVAACPYHLPNGDPPPKPMYNWLLTSFVLINSMLLLFNQIQAEKDPEEWTCPSNVPMLPNNSEQQQPSHEMAQNGA